MKERKKNSLYEKLKANMIWVLLFGVVFLSIGIMVTAPSISYGGIDSEKTAVFEKKWRYLVNENRFIETELPTTRNVSRNAQIVLKNKLPERAIKGATVLLQTSQQTVYVCVNGKLIYSNQNPTNAYHFIRLPNKCTNQEITVFLRSACKNYAGRLNPIYIGSKTANIFFLFHQNGFRFILGSLVGSSGFLLILMFLFAKGLETKSSILCLGSFLTCVGYWVAVESQMMQFVIPYPTFLTNSSFFALTLLPVFAGLYYYMTQANKFKKAIKCGTILTAGISITLALFSCINPLSPAHIFPFYLAFLGIYTVVICTFILIENICKKKNFPISVYGILLFALFAFCEIVFHLYTIKNYTQSNFFTFGMLLFCATLVIDSVQTFVKLYQDSVKVNALSVLAYRDSLTGLKNRTAFLEKLETIAIGESDFVTIVMFDINNLKMVNDTLGHLIGDALLRHSAKVVKSCLGQEEELYRIGGDEFVSIIRHQKEFDCVLFGKHMEVSLQKENQKQLGYSLSIAYGCATFIKENDKNLFDTLAKADEKMYTCKKMQKETIQ